jgi:hypothetical protein
MRRAVILAWRLQRAELVAVTLASAAIALAWLKVAADLAAVHGHCQSIGPQVAPCGGLPEAGQYFTDASQILMPTVGPMAGALPFVAGLVLGVPMASRELEHRTAHLAWPLAGSRVRWLGLRLVPLALLGLLALAPAAFAGEVMTRSFYPLTDPGANFEHYGIRGPLLVARFVPALLLGAAVGLLVGRQLPALLVAGALVAGLGAGLSVLRPFGATPVERPIGTVEGPIRVGNLYVGILYRDAQGNRIPDARAWELLGGMEKQVDRADLPRELVLVVDRERYPEVLAREAALLAGVTVLLGAALAWGVRSRRPS